MVKTETLSDKSYHAAYLYIKLINIIKKVLDTILTPASVQKHKFYVSGR